MPAKKTGARISSPAARTGTDQSVSRYIDDLKHPLKPAVVALRRVVLAADPAITEGIKWNAPSFRTRDDFATMNLRGQGALRLVLHAGAKARGVKLRGAVADPESLVEWLADDRGLVTFANEAEVAAKATALRALLRQWIRQLP